MLEKDKYDKIYKEDLRYADGGELYGSLCHAKNVLDYISTLNFKSVLDIGCGRGQFIELMIKQNKKAFGCDISQVLINKLHLPGAILRWGSMSEIPFQNSFDLVTAFDVLEHIPEAEIEMSLVELNRVTKKDAIVSLAWHTDKKWNMDLHVTIKNENWWNTKLKKFFNVHRIKEKPSGVFLHLIK